MKRTRCILLEPIDQARIYFRRYTPVDDRRPCPGPLGLHAARRVIGTAPITRNAGGFREVAPHLLPKRDLSDDRWPRTCDACGADFAADDGWRVEWAMLWERADTQQLLVLTDAPLGAMWFAWWLADRPRFSGFDGRALIVRTPGGDVPVDGVAPDCTRVGDEGHRCLIRHGEPPIVTMDKVGGPTCGAADLIRAGRFYGVLRGGYLQDA